MRRRVFLPGQAISMLGNGLANLAIPLLVLQLSHSAVAAVLASLPGSAGYVAVGLPAGVTVDRLDPWHVLITADIIRAGVFLGLFWLTAAKSAAVWLILVLAGTGALCRWLGPVATFAACAALSGIGLALMAISTGWALLLAANVVYCWAIIAASVTSRALRQLLVPRELLGRVTAAWRLGGQAVTLIGGLAAGVLAELLGGPRPVLAGAAALTVIAVAVGWSVGIRKEAIPAAAWSAGGD